MAVREFDATDDRVTVAGSSIGAPRASGGVGHSIVVIGKPASVSAVDRWMFTVTPGIITGLMTHDNELYFGVDSGDAWTNSNYLTTTDWQIMCVNSPVGTAVLPRFHHKLLGSGSWFHGNATTGDTNNNANNATGAIIGDGFAKWGGRIATVAVFMRQLSDLEFESIQTTPSTQNLLDLGAVGLWDLNQASTSDPVLDLVGDWDQTAIVGTTVIAGDDPPGWTFGLGAPFTVPAYFGRLPIVGQSVTGYAPGMLGPGVDKLGDFR